MGISFPFSFEATADGVKQEQSHRKRNGYEGVGRFVVRELWDIKYRVVTASWSLPGRRLEKEDKNSLAKNKME